jgi:hypothetical protein
MNPNASTRVIHGWSKRIVATAMITTPPATTRATLEFMGCGKLKNEGFFCGTDVIDDLDLCGPFLNETPNLNFNSTLLHFT